ncbi:uncharacterized protein LOC135211808 [Macrobrachium nipponense]|uniref:uncharacterized protein LOC135211808 n=1 Tax=Macrobrachium nipponense TaxID=159736 RepID=UPI0030C81119
MERKLESHIEKGQTIDKVELALINNERRRWREVLTRFWQNEIFLSYTLYQPNNGNFLKEVELMAQFDPVLKEHIAKVQGGASHTSYLGNIIQNEFIDCINTRWESRINSVEVVRFQAAKVRDALLEVRASTAEPAIKIEAQALAEEVGSYRFSICNGGVRTMVRVTQCHYLVQNRIREEGRASLPQIKQTRRRKQSPAGANDA